MPTPGNGGPTAKFGPARNWFRSSRSAVACRLQRNLVEIPHHNGGTTVKTQWALFAGATILTLTISAYAHHPFAAEYDWTKPVTLTGAVSKIEWTNPHAYLHVDAKDDRGQMKQWTLEMGSPSALTRAGWTRNTMKMGDQVTVEGWLSKSKDDRAHVKSIKLADGRELSGGSSIVDIRQAKNKPISN